MRLLDKASFEQGNHFARLFDRHWDTIQGVRLGMDDVLLQTKEDWTYSVQTSKLKQSRSFDKGDSFGAVFDISSPLMRLLDKASFELISHNQSQ
jgi:hypothetical protein